MASVLGIKGLSTPNTTSLVGAYGNDIINLATGNGYGLNLTPGLNVEFETFLQSVFFQNYSNTPLSFDGTVWSRKHTGGKVPLAKYIKRWNSQLYLGYINYLSTAYPSRVWFSNTPRNNTINWDLEYGTNLVQKADSPLVSSANGGFVGYGIQRGDPFYILTGPNAGEYRVNQIIQDQQIVLSAIGSPSPTPMKFASVADTFWVGGNWFDVSRDDNDFITWLGENNFYFYNQLLIYKRDSLTRYDGQRQTTVQGAPGTTSGRSVVNLHEFSIYFYGANGLSTGFLAYDGRSAEYISRPIENHIQGISPTMFGSIIAWREQELYRAYLGNVVNTNYNINIPNAVFTWSYVTRACSIDPITDVPTCATELRQGTTKSVYFGTTTDAVMLTPSGNSLNGQPIAWRFDTIPYYPVDTEYICEFTRIQVEHENAGGMVVKYKLHLDPFDTWDQFKGLGVLGSERTEMIVPFEEAQAAGIQLQFLGMDATKNTACIKKITIFYKKKSTVIQ